MESKSYTRLRDESAQNSVVEAPFCQTTCLDSPADSVTTRPHKASQRTPARKRYSFSLQKNERTKKKRILAHTLHPSRQATRLSAHTTTRPLLTMQLSQKSFSAAKPACRSPVSRSRRCIPPAADTATSVVSQQPHLSQLPPVIVDIAPATSTSYASSSHAPSSSSLLDQDANPAWNRSGLNGLTTGDTSGLQTVGGCCTFGNRCQHPPQCSSRGTQSRLGWS